MKILLAPDSFKGALDAEGVCRAMEVGVRAARPEATPVACPLADGGEGTGPLLARALSATPRRTHVLDPLGRERLATWWLTPGGDTAIVEMAQASGFTLLKRGERRAAETTSYGTGQLLAAALASGARRVLLCVGGSATVDGGAGCLQALGWTLKDAQGRVMELPPCGAVLPCIHELLPPDRPVRRCIEILCDVDNPLVGPRGAAPVFAPQKGAAPPEVERLAAGLEHWAGVLARTTGTDVRTLPGGGAAGGLPAALAAALKARLTPGFERVAELVRLDERLDACDVCFTGEGRLDEQTLGGKVVAGLARRSRVPVVAFVGSVRVAPGGTEADLARAIGLHDLVTITPPGTPLDEALRETAANMSRAVRAYLEHRT